MDQTLWPEFHELSRELQTYLCEVTDRVIREGIHGDDSDAEDLEEPRQLAGDREGA
jgi:cobalamin biosynthesis Mg chelatase CobN